MQTMSYSPTVHSSSRTLPPEFSTFLVKSAARWVVSRKFLMPASVQLTKETYVFMMTTSASSFRTGCYAQPGSAAPGGPAKPGREDRRGRVSGCLHSEKAG